MVNLTSSNLNSFMYNAPKPVPSKWFVFNNFPFDVLNKTEFKVQLEIVEKNGTDGWWLKHKKLYGNFFNRLEAEKYRLTKCMEYYTQHDDTNNYMIAKNEFNNIKTLHPEWLI